MSETRDRITGAAKEVFSRKGYDAAGVREIASAAGVNISAISYHFGGKEGLFKTLVAEELSKIRGWAREVVGEDMPARQRMEILVEGFMEFLSKEDSVGRIILQEMILGGERVKDIMFSHVSEIFGLIGGMLEDGENAGEIRRLDKLTATFTFVSFPLYMSIARPMVDSVRGEKGYNKAFIKKAARDFTDIIFNGIKNDGGIKTNVRK